MIISKKLLREISIEKYKNKFIVLREGYGQIATLYKRKGEWKLKTEGWRVYLNEESDLKRDLHRATVKIVQFSQGYAKGF